MRYFELTTKGGFKLAFGCQMQNEHGQVYTLIVWRGEYESIQLFDSEKDFQKELFKGFFNWDKITWLEKLDNLEFGDKTRLDLTLKFLEVFTQKAREDVKDVNHDPEA